MEIIEAPIFTKRIVSILSEDEYRALQWALVANPVAGVVIPGGHGLRKLRWAIAGSGKSAGIRVIYYCLAQNEKIYLVFSYKKADQGDLTKAQLKILSDYVKDGVL